MEHGRTQTGPSTKGEGHPHQGHLQATADVDHQQRVSGRAQPQGRPGHSRFGRPSHGHAGGGCAEPYGPR
eukprot:12757685-Alexandrium_andersonii.AAC.1